MGKGCHEGTVHLLHSFNEAFNFLKENGPIELKTARNTAFKAMASETDESGIGILFYQNEKEFARCYPCCWGHYNNCGGTWMGMYCKPLDRSIR